MSIKPNRTVVRHMSTLFEAGVVGGLTDGQLLERFAARGGAGAEAAFAALVERHGSMVLRVCRGILRDDHAAEDAFQATFLVLARKGGSLWVRDSVGPWLHRVTRRIAIHARAAADRRKAAEQRAAAMTSERRRGDSREHDLGPILDEEIDRLPDHYRMPVILCDLEGASYEEAARHLGCAVGTLKSRLARARERLRDRLTGRGVVPAPEGLGFVLATRPAEAAVPVALMKSTVLAAARSVATSAAMGGMVPPLVVELTEGALKSMRLNMMMKIGGFVVASGVAMSGAGLLAARAPGEQPVQSVPRTPQADAKAPDQNELAEVQEKLAKAEAREAELKEKLAKANAREAELKEKLAKANAREAEAREKLAKAEAREKLIKAEAREAEAKEKRVKAEAGEAEAKEKQAKAEAREAEAKEAEAKEKRAKAEAKEAEAKEAEVKEAEAKEKRAKAEAKEKQAKAKAN